jgi:hypothetical protein
MSALSERDMRLLAFERGTWRTAGAKEQAIVEVLGISATRYYRRAPRARRQRMRSPQPGTSQR